MSNQTVPQFPDYASPMDSPASSTSTAGVKRPLNRSPSPNPQSIHGSTPSSNTNSGIHRLGHSVGGEQSQPQQRSHHRSTPSASSFRNVSACNRCRLRKNRCDQNLPACVSCEKAGAKCVGYDPITKREIPRSYVNYLETRMQYLEDLLAQNGIQFEDAGNFDLPTPIGGAAMVGTGVGDVNNYGPSGTNAGTASMSRTHSSMIQSPTTSLRSPSRATTSEPADVIMKTEEEQIATDFSSIPLQGASDPRYLGSVSGISFARVVFAAVKSSSNGSQRGRVSSIGSASDDGTQAQNSMRDSIFGLASSRRKFTAAKFPGRDLGMKLVRLYFEHANAQTPVLHRVEFELMVERVYSSLEEGEDIGSYRPGRTAKEMYLLNIVFGIGAGIFLTKGDAKSDATKSEGAGDGLKPPPTLGKSRSGSPNPKRQRRSDDGGEQQAQPEEYHAAALPHLEGFLSSDSKGGFEELQAVLLLASYALLRPVAPGLWYIIGVAMRLAVDLGLHYEDGGVEFELTGRRAYDRDMRRRLWWCVYSLDRLVSTCVGRPFGISDEVVSTKFPSLLDDKYITKEEGFLPAPPGAPSYKHVAHHYFRLRQLQSEILQVLQYQSATLSSPHPPSSPYQDDQPSRLTTPFLFNHTIDSWHRDIAHRLKAWIDTAPRQRVLTGVDFSADFLDLNYWQTLIMLYRPSLKVPSLLATALPGSTRQATVDRYTRGVGIGSLHQVPLSRYELEAEETTCMIVAEAGSKILRLYRRLHRVNQINYTYLSTHHLFMAGIAFLYAIWHSTAVRNHMSLDEIEHTTWAGTSVLDGLTEKCPPAETCKKAFERMARATIQMCVAERGRAGELPVGLLNNPNRAREATRTGSGMQPTRHPTRITQRPPQNLQTQSQHYPVQQQQRQQQQQQQQQQHHHHHHQQQQQQQIQQQQQHQQHQQQQQQQQMLQQQQQQAVNQATYMSQQPPQPQSIPSPQAQPGSQMPPPAMFDIDLRNLLFPPSPTPPPGPTTTPPPSATIPPHSTSTPTSYASPSTSEAGSFLNSLAWLQDYEDPMNSGMNTGDNDGMNAVNSWGEYAGDNGMYNMSLGGLGVGQEVMALQASMGADGVGDGEGLGGFFFGG